MSQISVDLAEPNASAIITPGARIVRQATIDESIRWILVTVYEYKRGD
jgi:hypothetical protein